MLPNFLNPQICQALAPTLTGSLADQTGRRPAYLLCFLIYIVGNVALALQHSYVALLILRAVQSCGSSGTVALASAVAADVITSAERGTYMGIASLGNILAPSLGPILGGLLSQYLGWQAIFWFLAIAAMLFLVPFTLFFPETCRAIVGDGSIVPDRWWNRSVLVAWRASRQIPCHDEEGGEEEVTTERVSPTSTRRRLSLPNPLATLRLLTHLPTSPLLLANGLVFASYYAVTAGLPAQLKDIYALDDMAIGLSFIPAGLGSLVSATVNGFIVDWKYRRAKTRADIARSSTTTKTTRSHHCANTNNKPKTKSLSNPQGEFDIEKVRLSIGVPMTVSSSPSPILTPPQP